MVNGPDDVLGQAWAAVSGDDSGSHPAPPASVEMTGPSGVLPSRFAAEEVAQASVGVALLAAAALSEQRGSTVRTVSLDRSHVADAVRSERAFRVGGQPAGTGFAPLSRFWEAADGWVRTHANYPWHRRALVSALATSEDADAVASALGRLRAEEVEELVFAAGGIATAVRTLDQWEAHPQGRALAAEPLIAHRRTGEGRPRSRPRAEFPMAGLRVLDLTRVIAGPVCTRFLAALGAEVLRLDPPDHPDMVVGAVADSLLGKRSSFLDLRSPPGPGILHGLLDHADVVVCGYRPMHSTASASARSRWRSGIPASLPCTWTPGATAVRGVGVAASTAWCRRRPASPRGSPLPDTSPVHFPASCSTMGRATWRQQRHWTGFAVRAPGAAPTYDASPWPARHGG